MATLGSCQEAIAVVASRSTLLVWVVMQCCRRKHLSMGGGNRQQDRHEDENAGLQDVNTPDLGSTTTSADHRSQP